MAQTRRHEIGYRGWFFVRAPVKGGIMMVWVASQTAGRLFLGGTRYDAARGR